MKQRFAWDDKKDKENQGKMDSLDLSEPVQLTKEEEEMIDKAARRPPVYDDDCKPLSAEIMQRMLASKRIVK